VPGLTSLRGPGGVWPGSGKAGAMRRGVEGGEGGMDGGAGSCFVCVGVLGVVFGFGVV